MQKYALLQTLPAAANTATTSSKPSTSSARQTPKVVNKTSLNQQRRHHQPESEFPVNEELDPGPTEMFTCDQLMNHVKSVGPAGLSEEFTRKLFPFPTTILRQYVHSNYVNGFKQTNAYICTQNPLEATLADFWHMIWRQTVLTIAMTSKQTNTHLWPLEENDQVTVDVFDIKNEEISLLANSKLSFLTITHRSLKRSRLIAFCEYRGRMASSDGLPKTAEFLAFLSEVHTGQRASLEAYNGEKRRKYDSMLGDIRDLEYTPVCVLWDSVAGRIDTTGVFCVLDTCVERVKNTRLVNVVDACQKVSLQRVGTFTTSEEYLFVHRAFLKYARTNNLTSEKNYEGKKNTK